MGERENTYAGRHTETRLWEEEHASECFDIQTNALSMFFPYLEYLQSPVKSLDEILYIAPLLIVKLILIF